MDLKEKVVLITGSSDGIGAEAAQLFAKEGCYVAVTYNTQKSKAKKVFEECKKFRESLLVNLDVQNDDSVKECVEAVIDKFGAIDILVNNSGVIIWKKFVEQSSDEIENQVNVNLKGVLKMTKEILPYMQGQEEGIIINVSSKVGKEGYENLSTYSATKFAVRGFTQSIAKEFDEEKIRFYCVNPSATATKMTNFKGVSPKKVAKVIVDAAKESLGKNNGDDVDVEEYY